jgi:hypothetical protein
MSDNSRDDAIRRIREALKRRSGKAWSVTGGRGTAWGWIKVDAPPARQTWRWVLPDGQADVSANYRERDTGRQGGHTSPDERAELARLLGFDVMYFRGASIPASSAYYAEYTDRAEGRTPATLGTRYWD